MPDNQLGRDAAQISYQDLEVGSTIKDSSHSSLNGYKVDKMFGTTGDGLTAYALRDPGTGNVVIAFRGTSDGEDWKDNVGNLGWRPKRCWCAEYPWLCTSMFRPRKHS